MSNINTVGMKPDWPLIHQMVSDGLISARPHEEHPELVIYNYTAKAQYDGVWNEATLMCRGLIANNERVVARPFQKFFNHTEHGIDNIPLHLPYKVWDKLDGSLGISYVHDGEVRISTRGSMNSDQAKFATNYLSEHYPQWVPDHGHTYLFEIIYPENRIVVDYGDRRGLVLLAILETDTGHEVNSGELWDLVPFETVEYIGNTINMEDIGDRENKEGYVLSFEDGFRVKIKHTEYMRLHKILTGVSSRMIWEYLRDGRDFSEIVDNVPDEFYNWIQNEKSELLKDYARVEAKCKGIFYSRPDTDERRVIAEYFKEHGKLSGILFKMLDGGIYTDIIWKMIKPQRVLPYMDVP